MPAPGGTVKLEGYGEGLQDDANSPLDTDWTITRIGDAPTPKPDTPVIININNRLRSVVKWPGITANVVSFSYTNSHGIYPGTAQIVINPQDGDIETFGDLEFGDGVRPTIKLKDCHLDNIIPNFGPGGAYISLIISDRRWRWVQGYEIAGEYNAVDDHGNFRPWTVRSATELAKLCLEKMGEKKAQIAFPPGLTRQQAEKYDNFLRAGQRFPLTFANPNVLWDHLPAAAALQELAAGFGCRVMLDVINDQVLIQPQGYGQKLPASGTAIQSASQGIKPNRIPKYVGILTAPVKFQMRLALEGVTAEYDRYFVPVNSATYAPITKVATAASKKPDERGWDACPPPEFPNVEPTDRFEYTEAQNQARQFVFKSYRIKNNIDVDGSSRIRVPGLLDSFILGPDKDVMVSKDQAKVDPSQLVGRVDGRLDFRQQVILTNEKVQQIVPEGRRDIDIVLDPNRPNAANDPGALPDYYNGYSRDRPAECFGTYAVQCSQLWFSLNGSDIAERRKVYIPFQVDPTEQLVQFSDYVYDLTGKSPNRKYAPVTDMFVETGVHILSGETNEVLRGRYWLYLGGDAPPVWEIREDVITHILGEYTVPDNKNQSRVTGYRLDDFGDGKARAQYYLQGMRRRFQNWETQSMTYTGILSISPSGSVQQIQWNLPGMTTTAGVNCEFSTQIPQYPTRKLREAMPPDAVAKMLNAASSPLRARQMAERAGK